MRGINTILITGKIFSDSIPIGADTEPVSIMTRNFMSSTIVARVAVGIKASIGLVLPEPLVLALVNPEPLSRANIPEPLVLGNLPEPLDPGNIPESLDLGNTPEPLNLGNIPEPLVLPNLPEPLDPGNIPESLDLANLPEPLVPGNTPEPLDLANLPEPLVLAATNRQKLLMMRKKSSIRPSGLNTEKAG